MWEGEQPEHPVGHGNIDLLADTAVVALDQSKQYADNAVHTASGNIGYLDSRYERWPRSFAHAVQHACPAEIIDVMAHLLTGLPVLPVSADGAVDDTRINRPYRLIAHPQPVNDAWTESFEDHICLPDQAEEYILAFLGLEIKTHVALIAIHIGEIEIIVEKPSVFDGDDLGAMIGKHHGAVGTG